MTVSLILNGEKISAEIEPDQMLLNLLRSLGCKSIKCGCDTANCGACTVWVEGKPILSCSYPAARADGLEITTLEGVQEEAASFAGFMADQGADQCGYCNPGFVMNVLAMRRELPNPTEDDVKIYLAGNLCRCGGFVSQHRAIHAWLTQNAEEDQK